MKKYILTSPRFKGKIILGYTDSGNLVHYENAAEIACESIHWVNINLPIIQTNLLPFKAKIEGTLTEIPVDISFDHFWEVYDKKVNRKRAEPLYKKLAESDKSDAIIKIKSYHLYCEQTGRAIADPETYLNKRMFETNWYNLKK